jgi:putative membrane protein
MPRRNYLVLILGFLVPIVLLGFIYSFPKPEVTPSWAMALPGFNASMNTLCCLFLITGYVMIRKGNKRAHVTMMLSALGCSFIFLISYLTYHHFHGDTPFQGQGKVRVVYFFILISHILLSAINFPMILLTIFLAWKKDYESHRRWAKWTFPIWLYVSSTGVLIYLMLKIKI